MRGPIHLAAVLILAVGAACGRESPEPRAETGSSDDLQPRTLSGYGLSIELPRGWDGRIFRRAGVDHEKAVVQVANFDLVGEDDDVASLARRDMSNAGVVIGVAVSDGPDPDWWPRAVLPIEIRRSEFALYEGFAPNASGIRHFIVDQRAVRAFAAFGSADPGNERLREANAVLATLEMADPREPFERVARQFTLPRGPGLHTFTFQAPDPSAHAMDVYLSASHDADLALVLRTADGSVLRVLDSAGRECDRDERMGCEVHLPALEARQGGSWTGQLHKRSGPSANVSLRLVFVPLSR